jgi:hypothetical protein
VIHKKARAKTACAQREKKKYHQHPALYIVIGGGEGTARRQGDGIETTSEDGAV